MYQRYYDGYPASPYVPPDIVVDTAQEAEQQLPTDTLQKDTESDVSSISPSTEKCDCADHKVAGAGPLLGFQLDDIILIGLLIFLLAESSDDIVLPLIIGYIFLADKLPI